MRKRAENFRGFGAREMNDVVFLVNSPAKEDPDTNGYQAPLTICRELREDPGWWSGSRKTRLPSAIVGLLGRRQERFTSCGRVLSDRPEIEKVAKATREICNFASAPCEPQMATGLCTIVPIAAVKCRRGSSPRVKHVHLEYVYLYRRLYRRSPLPFSLSNGCLNIVPRCQSARVSTQVRFLFPFQMLKRPRPFRDERSREGRLGRSRRMEP